MVKEIGHFIGGKHVKGASGRFADIYNPNTGEVSARVALASSAELSAAIANAKEAQPGWAAKNPQFRARVMMKFLDLAAKHKEELAHLISMEHGKTIPDALGDLQRGVEVAEFAVGIPHLLKGEYTDGAGPGIDMYSMRQPLGVVAGITPFNFPAMIPLWKAAPAIARPRLRATKPRRPAREAVRGEILFMDVLLSLVSRTTLVRAGRMYRLSALPDKTQAETSRPAVRSERSPMGCRLSRPTPSRQEASAPPIIHSAEVVKPFTKSAASRPIGMPPDGTTVSETTNPGCEKGAWADVMASWSPKMAAREQPRPRKASNPWCCCVSSFTAAGGIAKPGPIPRPGLPSRPHHSTSVKRHEPCFTTFSADPGRLRGPCQWAPLS